MKTTIKISRGDDTRRVAISSDSFASLCDLVRHISPLPVGRRPARAQDLVIELAAARQLQGVEELGQHHDALFLELLTELRTELAAASATTPSANPAPSGQTWRDRAGRKGGGNGYVFGDLTRSAVRWLHKGTQSACQSDPSGSSSGRAPQNSEDEAPSAACDPPPDAAASLHVEP